MPGGRVHDAITFLLAAPAFAGTYALSRSLATSLVVTAAFMFGGLMFGPDLDTTSKQYSRWSAIRWIWVPYRSFFRHRSTFSHGILFGALLRVIYFLGVLTLGAFAVSYVWFSYKGGHLPTLAETAASWQPIGRAARQQFGEWILPMVFAGLWLGAASHTITDIAGTFIKTGRAEKLF